MGVPYHNTIKVLKSKAVWFGFAVFLEDGAMKMLKKALVVIVIVVVLAVVVVSLTMNSLVRKGIEVGAGSALGTETTVGSAKVRPIAGQVTIGDLVIGNPEGFKEKNFFSMSSASVDVKMGSLLSDAVVVEEIIISDPVLTIERKVVTTNLNVILGNLSKNAKAEEEKGEGKGYRINRILITGTTTRFLLAGKDTVEVKLPDIEIADLGTGQNNAVKIGRVTLEVLVKLTEESAKAAAGSKVPAKFIKSLDGAADKAKSAAKALTEELQKGAEELKKGADDLLKKLPGLDKED